MPSNPHHLPALLTAQRGGRARVAVAVPILHLGKLGKGLVRGAQGLLSCMVDAAVGTAPVSPITASPGAGPALPSDASLFPMRPFRCLALDLINSPLVSFSENEIGSAWEITRICQLL